MVEDRPVQRLELRAWVQPEMIGQLGPGPPERRECVTLPPRPVEGSHELSPQRFSQRLVSNRGFEFADDLQHDEATIARAENVKEQIMARDEVARAAETAWAAAKRIILESVDDPSSALRTRIADSVVHIGESLRDDADLRDKVDNWIVRAAQHVVCEYGVEITAIITETIERWDADEASRRIELHVGRDLQFIRINGTVVGALAGLIIYSVAQLLF